MIITYNDHKYIIRPQPHESQALTAQHVTNWNPGLKCYNGPATPLTSERILQLINSFDGTHQIPDEAYMLDAMAFDYTEAQIFKHNDEPFWAEEDLNREPWPHQRQALNFSTYLRSAMLSMAVGAGKTMSAIGWMRASQCTRILVVVPPHILDDPAVWPGNFEAHANFDYRIEALTQRGVKKKLERLINVDRWMLASTTPLIAVVNYESFWREPLWSYLLSSPLWHQAIVFDEIHKIKSHSGKASLAAYELASKCDRALGLTGTVISHSPLDPFGQYRALDAGLFGLSFSAFRDKYGIVKNIGDIPIVVGYRNQEELSERMARMTYFAGRDIVKTPEPVHSYRTFDLSNAERKLYDELENESIAMVESGAITASNALVKTARLAQITSGWAAVTNAEDESVELRRVGTSREDHLLSILAEEIPGNEPCVIFCRFTVDLDAVHAVAKKLHRPSYEVSGRAKELEAWKGAARRPLHVKKLGYAPAPILAINIRSAEGIDLTLASYAIYYSLGYSLGQFEQSEGRIARPGQSRFASFIHLIARNTLNEEIYAALKQHQSTAQAIYSYLKNRQKKRRT